MIAKLTLDGEPVWMRSFPGNPNEPINLAEIIEDSEGKILICGTQGSSPSSRRSIVLRYDPDLDVVLWYKQMLVDHPEVSGVLEKSPGGNFILRTNSRQFINNGIKQRSELIELDRLTGALVPGGISLRYAGQPNLRFENMVKIQENLYGVGQWWVGSASQTMLTKLSATNRQRSAGIGV